MNKPHKNGIIHKAGFVVAVINAWQGNISPQAPGFVKIDPGVVIAAEVVNHGSHKFLRVVRFQVEALEAFHGIGCGVCF